MLPLNMFYHRNITVCAIERYLCYNCYFYFSQCYINKISKGRNLNSFCFINSLMELLSLMTSVLYVSLLFESMLVQITKSIQIKFETRNASIHGKLVSLNNYCSLYLRDMYV